MNATVISRSNLIVQLHKQLHTTTHTFFNKSIIGIITWQGPIGSVTASTVAITGGSGDYEGVTGQMIVTNVQDSTQCPCGDGIHMSFLPPCFKYELFLDDVQGTI